MRYSKKTREVVLVDYCRSPQGRGAAKGKSGFFDACRPDDLGILIVEDLLRRTRLDRKVVDGAYAGSPNLSYVQGNMGRAIALMTCGFDTRALTLDRACTSGMSTGMVACMEIMLGYGDIYIAGGIESCSSFPIPTITADTDLAAAMERFGRERYLPNSKLFRTVDLNILVGMGLTAETLAKLYELSKDQHDQWAWQSHMRAAKAHREGRLKDEIVPMEAKLSDATIKVVDYDQTVRADSTLEKIRSLPPLYGADGVLNAASASSENDGAAFGVYMAKDKAKELGLVPMCTIVEMEHVACDPGLMGFSAIKSTRKVLDRAGMSVKDISVWQCNEAFATVPLALCKDLGVDHEKMNVNGCACSVGHAIGASGMRVLGTAAYEMNRVGAKYGLATICGGWGQGTAVILEREEYWDGQRAWQKGGIPTPARYPYTDPFPGFSAQVLERYQARSQRQPEIQ
jgi:acetyl-CoA acetyltransferase family protein